MEALKHLIANIPDWIDRLDHLNGQIEQRQIELAAWGEAQAAARANGTNGYGPARSLKNKGSTESLKPRDEPVAHPHDPIIPFAEAPQKPSPPRSPLLRTDANVPTAVPKTPVPAAQAPAQAPASPADSNTPSAQARQTTAMKAAGQAAGKTRARATLRKRQRAGSLISAAGGTPKYRTRSMIIVYYDSFVQSFFEELVKFVSASRNMMRKAKMAAKVAQIKRLAELEMPDDEEEDENEADKDKEKKAAENGTDKLLAAQVASDVSEPNPIIPAILKPDVAPLEASTEKDGEEELPPLRYVSTRGMRPISRSPNMVVSSGRRGLSSRGSGLGGSKQSDVYDELDKGLEYIQSMCEHAAHQFLRDGDCAEEVASIERRLAETKELADKEMERVKSDPEALKAAEEDSYKGRVLRPLRMAKETPSFPKDVNNGKLEVDEGIEDMDDPPLVFKSTRLMR